MRQLAMTALFLSLVFQACQQAPKQEGRAKTPATRERVTPISAPAGKVVLLNEKLRYVVLDFSSSRVPSDGQRLNLYRAGQKVAELKVTGAPMNQTITADILTGQAAIGDDARTD
jgi:hypothetical protein